MTTWPSTAAVGKDAALSATAGTQLTLDDLGTPLHETTFVVVDLETTGSNAEQHEITEIGAVKVRGGMVIGEFQTLVKPAGSVPAFVSVLTGITDRMLVQAPDIGWALPAFLEFAQGAVLVAHNAPFDMSFLKAACAKTERVWPATTVIDTVRLARALVHRDEAPNHKLGTLARLFGSPTQPDHRALNDARATVDVLHALIARLGGVGVTSVEELAAYSNRVPEQTRRKRHLAQGLPNGPGVYLFVDGRGRTLYVGTSRDVKARVRSYFTATERRTRMGEMIAIAQSVTAVECQTVLEAQVREIRLIAEHNPPYNRRSRRPEKAPWLKLTVETFPRLSIVRDVIADGGAYLGPFASRQDADLAMAAIHEAIPLRQCTSRLPRTPSPTARECMLAQIGRCPAPCVGRLDPLDYQALTQRVRRVFTEDPAEVVGVLAARARSCAEEERFEEATRHRDRLIAVLRAAARTQRLAPLALSPELIAARAVADRWEIMLVRYGKLAGSALSAPRADPMPVIAALRLSGEVVEPATPPRPAGLTAETELVLRWLDQPGVRLVDLQGQWCSPAFGAAAHLQRLNL